MKRNEKKDETNQDGDEMDTQKPLLEPRFQRAAMVVSPQPIHIDDTSDSKSNGISPTEDICLSLVGEWGWWQLRTALIVFLTKVPAAWFMACIIFTAPAPRSGDYECDTSYVMNDLGFPPNHSFDHPSIIGPDASFRLNYCKISINTSSNDDNLDVNSSLSIVPCNHFTFHLDKKTTLITQFDLVCSQSILVAVTQCFHLFGVLLGGVIATELMSFYSPRRVMMFGMALQIGIGVATGYVPLLWLHVAFRCLAAALCAIAFTSGNVIMMDVVGGRYKTIVAANFEHFWSVGVILLPVIGYFTNTWGEVYIAISLPTIFIIMLWWFLPDSPRWHLQKENINTAKEILLEGNTVNNKKTIIPDNLDDLLKRQAMDCICDKSKDSKSSWRQLFAIKGATWRVVCVVTAWSLIFTCYYGTLLNIRSFGREYLLYTTAIAGVCEIVGGFLGFCILMKSKQKWALAGSITFLSGILNCFIWLLPTYADGSHMILDLMFIQMINKIGINASLCVLYTCTAELFPAPHKRRIVYASTVIARIVFISAPMIGFTSIFNDGVPLTAFGGLTMLSGICVMFLSPLKNKESNNQTNVFTVTIKNDEQTKF